MDYFLLKPDGEQTGTYSIDQIRAMLNTGFIGPDTRYWHEGISDWQPVERIEESLNFPEHTPGEPHAAPPPHKWSGSLARAIPSPYAQKKPSGPIPMPEPTAPPAPVVPAPHRPAADVPVPSLQIEVPPPVEADAPRVSVAEERAAAPRAEPRRRFRLPRPSAVHVCIATTSLLAAAVITAIVLSRHPARSPLARVTLTPHNDCVLMDQAAIKPFEDDMRNLPVADQLRKMIAGSKDEAFVKSVTTGLQQEITKHEIEVTQKYLGDGKAEILPPGTYDTVAYLDDNGTLVVAKPGQPWVALLYRGSVVYAYIGADFHPIPR